MIMAVHARPAGLGRLWRTINSWLEEISFQTAVATAVAVLLFIPAAAIALALIFHGADGCRWPAWWPVSGPGF